MRDEAPVYYNEEHDFYALTRHDDVAAAFKDFDDVLLVARGCDLAMVRTGEPTPQRSSIIFMDPPEHRNMRSLLNKAFTPRAIQAQRDTGRPARRELSEPADPTISMPCRISPAPSPSRSSPGWPGVPEEFRQQVRHWIDEGLHREPGQIERRREGNAGQHRRGRCSTTAWSRSGARIRRTTCSAG